MSSGDKPTLLDDPFCIYPFNSINIMPSGQVKPCCAFLGVIENDGRPMSVYEHSLDEIWGSAFLRDMRRDLLAGKKVKACAYCYRQEKTGTISMGTIMTRQWRHDNPNYDLSGLERDNFGVGVGLEALDLDVGNLCNLKCRMCNSSYSSAIASDPVHSPWAPPGPVAARWKGDRSVIAPDLVLGVTYDGFGHTSKDDGVKRSWIRKRAALKAVIGGIGASGFSLRLFSPEPAEVAVSANGVEVLRTSFSGVLEQRFDLPDLAASEGLDLVLTSPGRFAVEEIALLRAGRGNSRMPFSRLSGGEPWYQSEEFLTQELLRRPEALRIIRVIGGEPLLIKETRSLLRRLIDMGVAGKITLGITTNATQLDDDWLNVFGRFKAVNLSLSLDGFGEVNEYIRFPSDWATIDQNIRRMAGSESITTGTNMTVQAYNLLNVTEMFSYCEEVGIKFGYHMLQHPPHLSVSAVPDAVRELAQARLRDFMRTAVVKPGSPNDPNILGKLADAIGTYRFDPKAQADFLKFTAELDGSRGQSLERSIPELWAMVTGAPARARNQEPGRGLVERIRSLIR